MSLFIKKEFLSHSEKKLDFKIECDALIDKDVKTLAYIISQKYRFKYAYGVPRGGERLAFELNTYANIYEKCILIVDDVLTTGKSMEEAKHQHELYTTSQIRGVVIFSRGKCPDWVTPIFQLWEE